MTVHGCAASNSGSCVVIFGDAMLDHFVEGNVSRLSPEAPVPVLLKSSTNALPGGAANVARNVSSLGGRALLFAIAGQDANGDTLERTLHERSIGGRLFRVADRPTTEKLRYIVKGQHLLRVDTETRSPVSPEDLENLLSAARDALEGAQALILSDYDKGTVSRNAAARLIEAAQARNVVCIVDPKGADFSKYRGASLLTPNARELADATGCDPNCEQSLVQGARQIQAQCGVAGVLVTRGASGMLVQSGDKTTFIRGRAREVFEVTGAGDTVIAALALALAGGTTLEDAAQRANVAGGLAVSRPGTAAPTAAELAHEIAQQDGDKILEGDATIRSLVGFWRDEGLRVGFTNGCFDLLHMGHLEILHRAREGCDRLIVGLNSDNSVRRLKGVSRPIQSQSVRGAVLVALACVDAVVIFDDDSPAQLIAQIQPDVLFKGADYSRDQVVGGDLVEARGGKVVLIPLVEGQSTTGTLSRIRQSSAIVP